MSLPSTVSAALHSLTGKRWVLPSSLRKGSVVEILAKARSIDLHAEVSWESLSDPLTLGEMKRAVERTRFALQKSKSGRPWPRENIGIIGDYDADGITGAAQLLRFFRRKGVEPTVILPHREKDGYGVKEKFIDALHAKGVTLLLTVDTGISHTKEIAYARNLGIDVIVLDHHSPPAELPDAILVHPALPLTPYPLPNANLSGSGVAFTFVRAVEDARWDGQEIDVALAAIGTVADVVPLLVDNRMIVMLGLEALMKGGSAPIFTLADSVRKEGERLTSFHIGYRIAPRINAAGRLSDPLLALTALTEGGAPLQKLTTLNEERQDLTEEMLRKAEDLLDSSRLFFTLASSEFHPGIIGLIAGKLTERYGKPSLVGAEREGIITCSLRSIPGFHVTEALRACGGVLSSFGGHAAAAGCTLKKEVWEEFTGSLEAHTKEILDPALLIPTLTIDAEIFEEHLTLPLLSDLRRLEPYGAANREPLFLLKNQTVLGGRSVGKEGRHLQCMIGGKKAVGFGLGHLLPSLPSRADIVCRLGIDSWSGKDQVQIFVEDIRTSC